MSVVHKLIGTIEKFSGDPQGYAEGYELGHAAGYEAGYTEGYAAGTAAGHAEGYAAGRTEGYAAGHTEGYSAGHASGRASGQAAGYEDGYAAGYASGKEAGYVEGYAAGENAGYERGYPEGYREGQAAGVELGKQAGYDSFWDMYLNNGNITNLTNMFSGEGWNEKTFFPKYNVFAGYKMDYTFRYSTFSGDFVQRMIDLGFGDTCYLSQNSTQPFRDMLQVTRLPAVRPTETTSLYSFNYYYYNNIALETIDCVIATCGSRSITFDSTFDGCTSLKNIVFEGEIANNISFKDSSLLSDASVQDIIDHLKDLTGATAKTLTLHADVGAKLTDEQKATITAKNWNLSY